MFNVARAGRTDPYMDGNRRGVNGIIVFGARAGADVSPLLVALPALAVYVLTCVMVIRETRKPAGVKPAEVIRNVRQ